MAQFIRHQTGLWVRSGIFGRQDLDVIGEIYGGSYRIEQLPKVERLLDVGAHIGIFATRYHELYPETRITCVEACRDNIACLEQNVSDFATVVHAACTYDPRPMYMANSIGPGGLATGGSVMVPVGMKAEEVVHIETWNRAHWEDRRPIPKVTVEQLMDIAGGTFGVIKLDCEGCEFSVLEHSPLDGVQAIVGEYHHGEKWHETMEKMVNNGWSCEMWNAGQNLGIFRLERR